jgi:hypothetical protein
MNDTSNFTAEEIATLCLSLCRVGLSSLALQATGSGLAVAVGEGVGFLLGVADGLTLALRDGLLDAVAEDLLEAVAEGDPLRLGLVEADVRRGEGLVDALTEGVGVTDGVADGLGPAGAAAEVGTGFRGGAA